MATWDGFLAAVDEVAAPEEVRTEVKTLLVAQGLATPAQATGLEPAPLVKLAVDNGLGLASQALLTRTIRTLNAAADAVRLRVAQRQDEVPSAAEQGAQAANALLQGQQASALRLAGALTTAPSTDVSGLLNAVGFGTIPSDAMPDAELFEKLHSAVTVASQAFTYVDLTKVLPLWLNPEAIGGKTAVAGESEMVLDPMVSTATVAQLGAALKSASTSTRFFRTLPQWLGCFSRYAVAALAAKQLTMASVLGHLTTVSRIAEEKRVGHGNSVALAILYDEYRRREWARRSDRKDSALNVEQEAWELDKNLLDVVTVRLGSTLSAAGLGVSYSSGPSTVVAPHVAAAEESALAKQAAAAESASRRASVRGGSRYIKKFWQPRSACRTRAYALPCSRLRGL